MALLHCQFFSQVLELASTMTVILPEPQPLPAAGRAQNRQHGHPVLYLLHGLSDDHTAWQRRTAIERYVEPLDLAVVMPAVQRSFYTDTATEQRYWTFVGDELPYVARSLFPLSDLPEETYVAGLSMGGYGAFKLALTHPEQYAAAASLSGTLDVARLAREEEKTGGAELRRIFGPSGTVANGPNDLFYLAERVARGGGPRPGLYQWCGTDDSLYEDNSRFRAHAAALGLPVTYEEGPGGHDWACWDRQIERVLAWLPGVRRAPLAGG